ncbi:MAG: zf-HC2 domain-containing protein [Planctomycetota bacterium]
MNCNQARDALSALLDNALTSDEARAAEEHAASCAACRALRKELAEVRQLLRGIDDADEPPGLAASVGRDVMASILGRPPGAKPAASRSADGGARAIAWTAAGISALALAAAATWAVWESSKREEKREERPAIPAPATGAAPTDTPVKPEPDPVRPDPPPVKPDPPPVKPPRPAPTHHGHLEVRATDAATRDAVRDLFRRWHGTFSASEPDVNGMSALLVDFEGSAGDAADGFEKLLREFQREHGASLRYWNYSSETR